VLVSLSTTSDIPTNRTNGSRKKASFTRLPDDEGPTNRRAAELERAAGADEYDWEGVAVMVKTTTATVWWPLDLPPTGYSGSACSKFAAVA
jgi:hypothetical protein